MTNQHAARSGQRTVNKNKPRHRFPSKLSRADVIRIRRLARSGMGSVRLARMYGLDVGSMYLCIYGLTHKEIPGAKTRPMDRRDGDGL